MTSMKLTMSQPLVVLAFAAVAFVGWISIDAIYATPRSAPAAEAPAQPREIAAQPHELIVAGVHRGLPRAVTERHLANLPTASPEPVDDSNDTQVLRSRYYVQMGAPLPHLMKTPPQQFRPGMYLLTVEYDTRLPNQPVTNVELSPAGEN
jgi:hypothetical protein